MDFVESCRRQEEILRFESLSCDCIVSVCRRAIAMLEERGASCHVRASVNGLLVYAYSMDGASINNQEWARRKAKLCERYSMSSLRVACRLEAEGKSLESCGMDKADYGLSGGSFPLLLSSGLCVGSITVSGLKGEEDHQIVADAIAAELGVQIPSVLA